MADTTWNEEAPSAPKKSGIPTWAWFCGGGCLLALLVVAGLGVFGFSALKKATDPELQWANLAKVLPYDERPAGVEMTMGFNLGLEQYQMLDSARGLQITIQRIGGESGQAERDKMFDADNPQFPQNAGVVKFQDLEVSKLDVQGRELRVMRMRMELAGFLKGMIPKDADVEGMGATAFVDLTPDGETGMLWLQMVRLKGGESIADDEIQGFLKPFHVGPKR